MMSTVTSAHSRNLHLSSLQGKIDELNIEQIDCLVIAHPDGNMIQKLVSSLDDPTIAVLPLNQVEWDKELVEVLSWAADHCISHVVVSAHSKTVEPLMPPQVYKNGKPQHESSQNTFDRIVAGTSNNEQRMSIAKERFANQMRRLSESDEFRRTKCNDILNITAVFYVAHSGFFMEFDLRTQTYHPFQ